MLREKGFSRTLLALSESEGEAIGAIYSNSQIQRPQYSYDFRNVI